MLVRGGFGTGKSHLLTHLEHVALSRNFVCSRVAVSKETPLYDLGKVFSAAMENGRIARRKGRFVEELALALKPRSDAYGRFADWADRAAAHGILSAMLPATLKLHEESQDLELTSEIESFWAGDKIRVARVRGGLRDIGQLQHYAFRAPRPADLPPQRLRFAAELVKGAGYAGWVVMLDELELIGSYSILQRGRSYAEIARWMGRTSDDCPGLIAVGTVTDDFAAAIISPDGAKKDRDYIGPRLENNPRHQAIAGAAETGMDVLERETIPLARPSDDDIARTVEALRHLYSDAYGWDAPALPGIKAGGVGSRGRMRHKVRAAINEWDLRRLRPGSRPDTVIEEYDPSYEGGNEDESNDAEGDPAAAE